MQELTNMETDTDRDKKLIAAVKKLVINFFTNCSINVPIFHY